MPMPKKTTLEIRLGDNLNIDDEVEKHTGFTYQDSYYDERHTEVRLYSLKGTVTPEQVAEMKQRCEDSFGRVIYISQFSVEEEDDDEADDEEEVA